jgi:predicted RNA-binding protein with PIN domain
MKQMILDGYNVIYELPVLKKNLMLSLEDARAALVNFMQIWVNNHVYKGKINIIFDGNDGSSGGNQSFTGDSQFTLGNNHTSRSINCSYSSSGQKADDYIICMVREIKNRSSITIVSNDNYVRSTCSSLGAAIARPSFLIDSPKLKKRKINTQKSSKKISPVQEKEINEFLKEKWGIE